MSVYIVIEPKEVSDKQKYGEYVQKVPQIIEKFGGKFLSRGGQVMVISGDWNPARLVIIEFSSMDKLQAWWHSPEYRKIAPLREQSAKVNAVVVEGI
jgi:uncharacterized protein (DUF1330 family)